MADDNDLDIKPENIIAGLSYVGFLVIIPLLQSRGNAFIAWHAKQGLVIMIGYVIAFLLSLVIRPVSSLLWIYLILVSVLGFVNALQGKRWLIPGIGHIAKMFNA